MKTKNSFKPALAVVCFAAFGLILLAPSKASLQTVRPEAPGPADLSGGEAFKDVLNPKMDYVLAKLYDIDRVEGADRARAFAAQRGVEMDVHGVRIEVESSAQNAALGLFPESQAVKSRVQSLGGFVERIHKNLVQGRLPIPALDALSSSPSVRYVRVPLRPAPLAEIVSEGVAVTGADLWQSVSAYRNTGGGTKVAVLDAGFTGYQALLGTELPSAVTAKSFRADGNLAAEVHGTACAEIVHDMAPNARLWLVNSGSLAELYDAVEYLVEEGVKVISYSMGWWNAGDGKGTGPVCDVVDYAAENGILWVNSAGNSAEDHWEGTFADSDNDGWLNFSGGDEILQWWVPAYTVTGAYVNWDDWGTWNGSNYSGSSQDYDITLYYYTGGQWKVATSSQNMQTGNQWPVEQVGDYYGNAGMWWGLAIKKYSATRNCKLEVFTYGNSDPIEYNVPQGSLLIPSDSPSALTVGASDWRDDSYHSYSSRGPTHNGADKPDISAPSGVSTSTYGAAAGPIAGWPSFALMPSAFYGTSASAPCAAGAAALFLEKTPFTPEQTAAVLKARAVDLGDPGADYKFGRGRLNLKKK